MEDITISRRYIVLTNRRRPYIPPSLAYREHREIYYSEESTSKLFASVVKSSSLTLAVCPSNRGKGYRPYNYKKNEELAYKLANT